MKEEGYKVLGFCFCCVSTSCVTSVLPPVGSYCNRTWDGWLCWGDSAPGTIMQMCPGYFVDFDPTGEAFTSNTHTHSQNLDIFMFHVKSSFSKVIIGIKMLILVVICSSKVLSIFPAPKTHSNRRITISRLQQRRSPKCVTLTARGSSIQRATECGPTTPGVKPTLKTNSR